MRNYYGKLLKLLFFKFRLEMGKVLLCYKCISGAERETEMNLHEQQQRDVLKNYNESIDKYVKFSIFHRAKQKKSFEDVSVEIGKVFFQLEDGDSKVCLSLGKASAMM